MIDWKFKEDAKPQGSSDGFWYDMANGYIKPEEVLVSKSQIEDVEQALSILQDFEQALEESELLLEF